MTTEITEAYAFAMELAEHNRSTAERANMECCEYEWHDYLDPDKVYEESLARYVLEAYSPALPSSEIPF